MPEKLPAWIAEEISGVEWGPADTFKGTGYFLDLSPKNKSADVQLYEPSPEGRYILTVDVPDSVKMDGLKKGYAYLFEIRTYRSKLSDKVKQFLAKQYQVSMDTIYRYEMASAEEIEEQRPKSQTRPKKPASPPR